MGLFRISVKFLAWGLCLPGEETHRPTPREPEEADSSPVSGQSLNRPLREIGAVEFAGPTGSLAPSGSEDEDDDFSLEEEGTNDARLSRSFDLVRKFGPRMDKVGSRLGTDDDVSCCIYGAGRGGRTPTRLPSADFESVFYPFAGPRTEPQKLANRQYS
jgi:hypothetical protein